MFKCSYCDETVKEQDFNSHAENHFIMTRGTDHSGQAVSSRIKVDYLYVQDT